MSPWIQRHSAWSRILRFPRSFQTDASQPGQPFFVIEADDAAFRIAHVRRRGREIELLGLESCAEPGDLAAVLAGFHLSMPVPALVVTHEAMPDAELRTAPASDALVRLWRARLAATGLRLERVYPLVGCPLLSLEVVPKEPLLYLQVERKLIAVMEFVGGRPTELEIFPVEEATVERCRELVGEGCPEVLLAGAGGDLSAIGYELAKGGGTWARVLRPSGLVGGESSPSLAAIVGAARHARGLGCVPALVLLDSALPLR